MLTLWRWMTSQNRPAFGNVGTPSNTTSVAPTASGPYVMYECPVTQPMSAVHQKTSVGLMSNTHCIVSAHHSR